MLPQDSMEVKCSEPYLFVCKLKPYSQQRAFKSALCFWRSKTSEHWFEVTIPLSVLFWQISDCTKPSKQHPPKDHFTVLSTCDDHECDFMLVVMVNFKKQLLSLSFWLTTHFHDFYSHGELNSKCDVLSDSVLTEVFVVNRIKRVRKTNFSFAMRE